MSLHISLLKTSEHLGKRFAEYLICAEHHRSQKQTKLPLQFLLSPARVQRNKEQGNRIQLKEKAPGMGQMADVLKAELVTVNMQGPALG